MNASITSVTVEPGERAPAPEPVRLVQLFVNTVDLEDGDDALADPDGLREWLIGRELLDARAPTPAAAAHQDAIALREALRALAYANGGHRLDAGAVDTVNDAAARAGLHPVLTGPDTSETRPSTADAIDAALGRIVAALHAGIADGTWPRLKVCGRDSCRWAFYDHSRNRSGHWCSMTVCGSREKNRRAYRRRKRASSQAAPTSTRRAPASRSASASKGIGRPSR
jgi:predicted RNA-binding Zn ribbon-like protein